MSHELRTPLNSAALGLKLLIDEFGSSEDPRDADHLDTASDVSKSVSAAVEILDGLLNFDKLESGIMELHKQEVKVIEFLRDCVKPFAPQAREKGTELHLIAGREPEETSGVYYIDVPE